LIERTVKMMNAILVTGGAGFIGSNFIEYWCETNSNGLIVNLDKLTYAGNLDNTKGFDKLRHVFCQGDIADRKFVHDLFQKYDFECVVNFAAESHVDRSIENPDIFVQTNVLGTQVLLDETKKAWTIGTSADGYPVFKEGVRFHQVSTDEVYGALGREGFFTEETPLAPNSPYSSTKTGADLLVRAYFETYKMPVSITRCSNNYGANQFPEKLIPHMITRALADMPLPVYGDGMQIRDWLHVKDHCSAIATVLEHGVPGRVYNIGGNNEKANLEIVRLILQELGKPESLITYVQDRLGHDRRYAIDNTRITTELGWKPSYTFEEGIRETIQWYLNNSEWLERIKTGAYRVQPENQNGSGELD